MKKDETVNPNVYEVETANGTRVKFAMQSDDKNAPSVMVMTVEQDREEKTEVGGKTVTTTVTDKIEVLVEANEAEAMYYGIKECIPPLGCRNNL